MSDYCKACGTMFAGLTAFDAHRTGKFEPNTRRCMTHEEMLKARKRDGSPIFESHGGKMRLWQSEEAREALRNLSNR